MKFRGLLIAVVILAILGGLLFWSNRHKQNEPPSSASKSPAIVRITPADVTTLTIQQNGQPPVTLTRQGTNWEITAPKQYPADASTVTSVLTSLQPLLADEVVEDKATDLAQFGLADPAVTVSVTSKNNATDKVIVGDDTPAGGDVYVALAGNPRVFTAASYIKSSLNKSLDDLRDKRLLPVESSSVTTMDLTRKGQEIAFGRVKNGWQIQKPKPYRTDTFQVDDLLEQAVGAKWDPSATAEAAKNYAKAKPVATLTLTGSSGTDTLDVRKGDDNAYYAKSSAIAGTYKVDPTGATALNEALSRGLDDFRNKQLFDFGYNDPDKIEYQSGSTSLILTHSGNAWTSGGKTMDTDSAEQVVTALRDLAAAKFLDTGYTRPDIQVTVTSGSGSKVEKVGIQTAKDGTGIAKRDDGPSLYSVDSATLQGLTSAIKGLKPAAPAKKK